jgi:hypothetical protein
VTGVKFEINQAAIDIGLSESRGLVRELEAAAAIVVEESRQALSAVQYVKGTSHGEGAERIPFMRSGHLANSVHALIPQVDEQGLYIQIVTNPAPTVDPRFGGRYDLWLRSQNYRFLPVRDYYHYDLIG